MALSDSFEGAAHPPRHLGTLKVKEKSMVRKDSIWFKLFGHGGGRVSPVRAAEEHTVDMSRLFLGPRFAHGAHSRLYHGMYKDEAVAVKIVHVPDDDEIGNLSAKLEQQFDREVTCLSRLHHSNVIKFVAACKKAPVYCIITEYLSGGSLRGYLNKLDHKPLPLGKLIEIALDIARGMEFIQSQAIVHLDLKPENVLIDKDFHMKIADFGIACEEEYCNLLADGQGTYRWMAPEMIRRQSCGRNRKVDVYSFGLMLWEMVAGRIPFEDMNPFQAAFAVVNKNLRPEIPSECPAALRGLMEQCWSSRPDKRPEFSQIVALLQQFQCSLRRDGTLMSLLQNSSCRADHKKGLFHWMQNITSHHNNPSSSSQPKPKFT